MKAKLNVLLISSLLFFLTSLPVLNLYARTNDSKITIQTISINADDGDGYIYEIVYINGVRWIYVYNSDKVLVQQYEDVE